jgi:hypothetical protein
MIFKVHSNMADPDKMNFFRENPGAEAISEFLALSPKQMFAVCLIADRDYDSPLRTLSDKERRTKAVKIAGYPMETDGKRPDKNARNIIEGKVESMEIAIAKYIEIQYDEDAAVLAAMNNQIREAIDIMNLDKREACKVVKSQTNRKTGEKTTTEYVDMAMVTKITVDAMKMGIPLESLKGTRDTLQNKLKKVLPVDSLMTYTIEDVIDSEDESDDYNDARNSGGSTLDAYMSKEAKIKANGTTN